MKDFVYFLYDVGRGRKGKWWLTFLIFFFLNFVLYLFFKIEVKAFSFIAVLTYLSALLITAVYLFITNKS